MEKIAVRLCPRCELNYIRNNHDELCELCNIQTGVTKAQTVEHHNVPVETDFTKIISGKSYGTNTRTIYERFCQTLKWDISKANKFGMNKTLFAFKADTDKQNSVWFLSHSNRTQTKAESKRTGVMENGAAFRNIISDDNNIIKENISKEEDKNGFDGINRITFAKNKYGQYEFLGIYKMIRYENFTREYERISYVYPI